MDMVERVARALADEARFIYERNTERWDGAAIVAIEAMREPTEAMLEAYVSGVGDDWYDAVSDYQFFIDSILKSTRQNSARPARRGEVDEAR
jgi:hypothetical protein